MLSKNLSFISIRNKSWFLNMYYAIYLKKPDMQVAYVTHSPTFVNPRKFEDIRRVIRCPEENASIIISSTKDNIISLVSKQIDANVESIKSLK